MKKDIAERCAVKSSSLFPFFPFFIGGLLAEFPVFVKVKTSALVLC